MSVDITGIASATYILRDESGRVYHMGHGDSQFLTTVPDDNIWYFSIISPSKGAGWDIQVRINGTDTLSQPSPVSHSNGYSSHYTWTLDAGAIAVEELSCGFYELEVLSYGSSLNIYPLLNYIYGDTEPTDTFPFCLLPGIYHQELYWDTDYGTLFLSSEHGNINVHADDGEMNAFLAVTADPSQSYETSSVSDLSILMEDSTSHCTSPESTLQLFSVSKLADFEGVYFSITSMDGTGGLILEGGASGTFGSAPCLDLGADSSTGYRVQMYHLGGEGLSYHSTDVLYPYPEEALKWNMYVEGIKYEFEIPFDGVYGEDYQFIDYSLGYVYDGGKAVVCASSDPLDDPRSVSIAVWGGATYVHILPDEETSMFNSCHTFTYADAEESYNQDYNFEIRGDYSIHNLTLTVNGANMLHVDVRPTGGTSYWFEIQPWDMSRVESYVASNGLVLYMDWKSRESGMIEAYSSKCGGYTRGFGDIRMVHGTDLTEQWTSEYWLDSSDHVCMRPGVYVKGSGEPTYYHYIYGTTTPLAEKYLVIDYSMDPSLVDTMAEASALIFDHTHATCTDSSYVSMFWRFQHMLDEPESVYFYLTNMFTGEVLAHGGMYGVIGKDLCVDPSVPIKLTVAQQKVGVALDYVGEHTNEFVIEYDGAEEIVAWDSTTSVDGLGFVYIEYEQYWYSDPTCNVDTGDTKVSVRFNPDSESIGETSWMIVDKDELTILMYGTGEAVFGSCNLPLSDSYKLLVYDKSGNGMNQGGLTIYLDDTLLLTLTNDFGYAAEVLLPSGDVTTYTEEYWRLGYAECTAPSTGGGCSVTVKDTSKSLFWNITSTTSTDSVKGRGELGETVDCVLSAEHVYTVTVESPTGTLEVFLVEGEDVSTSTALEFTCSNAIKDYNPGETSCPDSCTSSRCCDVTVSYMDYTQGDSMEWSISNSEDEVVFSGFMEHTAAVCSIPYDEWYYWTIDYNSSIPGTSSSTGSEMSLDTGYGVFLNKSYDSATKFKCAELDGILNFDDGNDLVECIGDEGTIPITVISTSDIEWYIRESKYDYGLDVILNSSTPVVMKGLPGAYGSCLLPVGNYTLVLIDNDIDGLGGDFEVYINYTLAYTIPEATWYAYELELFTEEVTTHLEYYYYGYSYCTVPFENGCSISLKYSSSTPLISYIINSTTTSHVVEGNGTWGEIDCVLGAEHDYTLYWLGEGSEEILVDIGNGAFTTRVSESTDLTCTNDIKDVNPGVIEDCVECTSERCYTLNISFVDPDESDGVSWSLWEGSTQVFGGQGEHGDALCSLEFLTEYTWRVSYNTSTPGRTSADGSGISLHSGHGVELYVELESEGSQEFVFKGPDLDGELTVDDTNYQVECASGYAPYSTSNTRAVTVMTSENPTNWYVRQGTEADHGDVTPSSSFTQLMYPKEDGAIGSCLMDSTKTYTFVLYDPLVEGNATVSLYLDFELVGTFSQYGYAVMVEFTGDSYIIHEYPDYFYRGYQTCLDRYSFGNYPYNRDGSACSLRLSYEDGDASAITYSINRQWGGNPLVAHGKGQWSADKLNCGTANNFYTLTASYNPGEGVEYTPPATLKLSYGSQKGGSTVSITADEFNTTSGPITKEFICHGSNYPSERVNKFSDVLVGFSSCSNKCTAKSCCRVTASLEDRYEADGAFVYVFEKGTRNSRLSMFYEAPSRTCVLDQSIDYTFELVHSAYKKGSAWALGSPVVLAGDTGNITLQFTDDQIYSANFFSHGSPRTYGGTLKKSKHFSCLDFIDTTCPSGQAYIRNAGECQECKAGLYVDELDPIGCRQCPPGSYGLDGKECNHCDIGLYNPYAGMSECKECTTALESGAVECLNSTSETRTSTVSLTEESITVAAVSSLNTIGWKAELGDNDSIAEFSLALDQQEEVILQLKLVFVSLFEYEDSNEISGYQSSDDLMLGYHIPSNWTDEWSIMEDTLNSYTRSAEDTYEREVYYNATEEYTDATQYNETAYGEFNATFYSNDTATEGNSTMVTNNVGVQLSVYYTDSEYATDGIAWNSDMIGFQVSILDYAYEQGHSNLGMELLLSATASEEMEIIEEPGSLALYNPETRVYANLTWPLYSLMSGGDYADIIASTRVNDDATISAFLSFVPHANTTEHVDDDFGVWSFIRLISNTSLEDQYIVEDKDDGDEDADGDDSSSTSEDSAVAMGYPLSILFMLLATMLV